ncbi:MAG: ribokinase [Armatimonadota bacterium]|nr:ribokinase [bacterium]
MSGKIVVIGSFNMDMIVTAEHIPKPGETVVGGKFASALGGKGANQAIAAARAGGKVAFVARVGNDPFATEGIRSFKQNSIDTDHVIRDSSASSGVALIMVDKLGENLIAVAPGANDILSPDDINAASELISSSEIMIIQLEIQPDTVDIACKVAYDCGVKVLLNPAPARELNTKLLHNISIITPNETEAQRLTGIAVEDETSADAAATALRSLGVDTVIITLGARGAYISDKSFRGVVPGFKVNPIDTTAAGDVFNGALAVALVEGLPLTEAARFANAAAAISTTRPGAQPSVPYRHEIDAVLGDD